LWFFFLDQYGLIPVVLFSALGIASLTLSLAYDDPAKPEPCRALARLVRCMDEKSVREIIIEFERDQVSHAYSYRKFGFENTFSLVKLFKLLLWKSGSLG